MSENYPQLRAVESFLQLQEQLTATEDKLEYARRFYNTSGRDYNIALQSFPRNLLASSFGFHAVAFFQRPAERLYPQRARFFRASGRDRVRSPDGLT